jgi:RNA polymerase sigma factor (sigma-70 family)
MGVMRLGAGPQDDAIRTIACDPVAFEAFYREHVEVVQRFVARRVGDRDIAADLTADIFVAAIESAERYRHSRGSETAWLFGVARNVVIMHRRRSGRGIRAAARFAREWPLEDDAVSRIDERLDAEAKHRELFGALDRLPGGQRAVMELVAIDGLSVTEGGHCAWHHTAPRTRPSPPRAGCGWRKASQRPSQSILNGSSNNHRRHCLEPAAAHPR